MSDSSLVGVDEAHASLIIRVVEDTTQSLEHGCNSCTASHENQVLVLVGLVRKFRDGLDA